MTVCKNMQALSKMCRIISKFSFLLCSKYSLVAWLYILDVKILRLYPVTSSAGHPSFINIFRKNTFLGYFNNFNISQSECAVLLNAAVHSNTKHLHLFLIIFSYHWKTRLEMLQQNKYMSRVKMTPPKVLWKYWLWWG